MPILLVPLFALFQENEKHPYQEIFLSTVFYYISYFLLLIFEASCKIDFNVLADKSHFLLFRVR